jgi:hypothetical protein
MCVFTHLPLFLITQPRRAIHPTGPPCQIT